MQNRLCAGAAAGLKYRSLFFFRSGRRGRRPLRRYTEIEGTQFLCSDRGGHRPLRRCLEIFGACSLCFGALLATFPAREKQPAGGTDKPIPSPLPARTKTSRGQPKAVPCSVFKKSHRVRGSGAANKIQSVFCGGVYVAKNSLRGVGVSQAG